MKKTLTSLLAILIIVSIPMTLNTASAANPIDSAVSWAVAIANDNSHGYDQTNRWGPDYDCSTLVISAYQQAGVPVKTNGATYTGNMYNVFVKTGFSDVTSKVTLKTGAGLQKGDVLLNSNDHTAMVSSVSGGNVTIVHARINEKGKATGGQTGDQNGSEICTQAYTNRPWKCVLRYGGGGGTTPTPTPSGYYPKYTGTSGSITVALGAVGVDSSYANRAKIAAANGISNYSGTAAQNTTMLNLLKKGTLKKAGSTSTPTPTPTPSGYYPKYTGSSTSITAALNAVGVDSSYANRTRIAAANGISNYSGTAAQNTTMLNLLKKGTLKKAYATITPTPASSYPKYTGSSTSITVALKAVGVDSSYTNRTKIAKANGISNYTGTAAQNTTMLNLLKKGTLKRA